MQCLIAGKKAYDEIFFQQIAQDSSAENRVIAHMKATYHFEQTSNTKGAGLRQHYCKHRNILIVLVSGIVSELLS